MKKQSLLILLSACLQTKTQDITPAKTINMPTVTQSQAHKSEKKYHKPLHGGAISTKNSITRPIVPTAQSAPLNPKIEAGLTKMSQTLGITLEELKASTIVDVIQLIEKKQSSIAQKIDKDRNAIIQTLDKETSTPEFIHTAGSKRVARNVSHAAAPRNTYDRTGSGTNPVQAFFLFGAMILDVCGF